MANPDEQTVVENILEPSPLAEQIAAPEHYPFLFSFLGEDVLEVTSWNSATGVSVTVQGRIHTGINTTVPFTHTHVANTDRTAKTTVITMPRGELLNAIAFVSAGSPLFGQTFVRVAVRRGAGAAFDRLGLLIQGPVSANVARAFPGSIVVGPFEAEPVLRTITGTTPAAGADIIETVPTGARWELTTARWAFTTSVTIGSRRPSFAMLSAGGVRLFRPVNATNHPENAGPVEYFAAPTVGYAADANLVNVTMPMPRLPVLTAGQSWRVQTIGIKVDDQLTAPTYVVREWLDI